jgi:aryl-alcohol dehydrogenase-like predicted oxidoreductase
MNYRTLGHTGLKISDIGYGAWGISGVQWIGAQDDESVRSLQSAYDHGVNFFDTALAYGDGHSEQLIRKAFGTSHDVIIASKIPPKSQVWSLPMSAPLRESFPQKYVLDCLDQSLRNLGREQIDLMQFHTWVDSWASDAEWQETVRKMKQSGKARFIGISVQGQQPTNVLKAVDTGLVNAVQVIHNIFEQIPEDELFPYAEKHQIGIIARVPFDEGSLTGKVRPDTTFAPDDFRSIYFKGDKKRQVWERVQSIAHDVNISVDELPELALRYCLSFPAVSTVIPGMRNVRHVESNTAASDKGPLSPDVLSKLKKYRWVRDFWSD